MDTKKAERFVLEATGLYASIVTGSYSVAEYNRLAREYKDVDKYAILKELRALVGTPIDGRKWNRIRARIDAKALKFRAHYEGVNNDVI